MRAPTSIQFTGIFFLIAIAVLITLIATHKTNPSAAANTSITSTTENTVSKYIDAIEKQNELDRDQKEQADKLAKLAKAKKDSVECQFWMQQKQNQSTNPRLDEKLTQFCELQPDQTTSAPKAAQ
jgi:uncharacterized protein YcbK (DUF882 family)